MGRCGDSMGPNAGAPQTQSEGPCNASPGNYDNNSVAVGVGRSLVGDGGGAMGWGSPRSSEQGQVKVACWASPRTPLCHKLFPSCRTPPAARYTAKPLCLVATGDKARADGRVIVLAPPAVARSAEELIIANRENA
ncbi:hypothetical protein JOQ06_029095 [Pogonophryne albipinna]|uniref:Uncharacterized protein n=1 Tax=Pogonophryne albipinna TaxID=1090488 RepID=A0AAD6BA11_9TELE|nr:hypothetical protein JOQ06_029095 [Pogonophryne albipinna]